jgi:hypothetical protein
LSITLAKCQKYHFQASFKKKLGSYEDLPANARDNDFCNQLLLEATNLFYVNNLLGRWQAGKKIGEFGSCKAEKVRLAKFYLTKSDYQLFTPFII